MTHYQIKPVQQYLDTPVTRQAVGGGFYMVYGYTRWAIVDTATGQQALNLYQTQSDAQAGIQTFEEV